MQFELPLLLALQFTEFETPAFALPPELAFKLPKLPPLHLALESEKA